jgi:hypothetical protein
MSMEKHIYMYYFSDFMGKIESIGLAALYVKKQKCKIKYLAEKSDILRFYRAELARFRLVPSFRAIFNFIYFYFPPKFHFQLMSFKKNYFSLTFLFPDCCLSTCSAIFLNFPLFLLLLLHKQF